MITTLKTDVTETPIEGATGVGNQKYSTDFEVYDGETLVEEKSAYGVESEVSNTLSGNDLKKTLWKQWVTANDASHLLLLVTTAE